MNRNVFRIWLMWYLLYCFTQKSFFSILLIFQNNMSSGYFLITGVWIHSVCFSVDGNKLAWVGHDCSLSIADASGGGSPVVKTIRNQYLPLLSCIWVAPNSILAGGHDCCPILFNYTGPSGGISEGKMVHNFQCFGIVCR